MILEAPTEVLKNVLALKTDLSPSVEVSKGLGTFFLYKTVNFRAVSMHFSNNCMQLLTLCSQEIF